MRSIVHLQIPQATVPHTSRGITYIHYTPLTFVPMFSFKAGGGGGGNLAATIVPSLGGERNCTEPKYPASVRWA